MASFFKPPRFLMRDRAAARTVVPQSRNVTCYRCAASLPVSGYAESASCPKCAGNLRLLPLDITKGHWGTSLMTTESIIVHPEAQVIANIAIASLDITISGSVHAMCIAGGTVTINETGELKGGIRAARARPGTGPAAQIEMKPFEDPLAPPPPEPTIRIGTSPHTRLRVVR